MKRKKGKKTLQQALLKGDVVFGGHVEVVGGYYHKMWEAKVDDKLKEGVWLSLSREPNNVHDSNAIAVFVGKTQIGYIGKDQAKQLAPFMDAGVRMALRVLSHSGMHQPIRLTARLYIQHVRKS